ncbi:EAL domain-containing protein [Ferrimonas sp.]|uniref:EAL domain-containing protein n=1 Tax=Ferrimonas sp. TaxID=2080861 RepID=UPI003A8D9B17
MESALHKREFEFYYQPKVSMITGEICGAEALIRWIRADGTVVLPGAFIPQAESNGFINRLTLCMVKRLIEDIGQINKLGQPLPVSFNVSAHDFQNRKLVKLLMEGVARGEIVPEQIEIELTETVVLNECPVVIENLNKLKNLGIRLVMDDYCRGFSNLGTLARWPFSTIKIDKSIISQVEASEKELSIVQSSIQMAHNMDLEIVAEGVETESCYRLLQNTGCSVAQGYWISPPLPLKSFLNFLQEGRHWPSQLLGMLHMAQLDHIQWRKAVIDSVYNLDLMSDANTLSWPEAHHTQCRLGKWLYGPGRCFSNTIWFNKLHQSHKDLHQTLAELMVAVDAGQTGKPLVDLMRKLSRQSDLVMQMLHELEHYLVEQRLVREDRIEFEGLAVVSTAR